MTTMMIVVNFGLFRCGHCLSFAPEFVEASQILKTVVPSVSLLEVIMLCFYWIWI